MILRFAATFLLSLSAVAAVADPSCSPDRVDLRGDWGQASFTVELAETPAQRSQGLMNREFMARNAGMLFLFDPPRQVAFWMKNTLIPLDMIFVDHAGVVQHVHQNAIPHDETGIDGGPGVFAVLEINGGLSGELGLETGSQLRHPAFGAHAVWPCEAP